ncbi:signal peptide peptidase SppA [Candidatus Woesearchaeota archaeon]|nr:signal peptide peptidase SppA [Candidatus Woesearchaeota archaeon]
MPKRGSDERPSVLRTILTIIGILSGLLSLLFFGFLFFTIFSAFSEPTTFAEGNVAVIPIMGVILPEADGGAFSEGSVASRDIVDWIEEAEADDSIQAVIFDIDSPGGTPVASEEIMMAIRDMDKPSVALIREIGASGAYWAASAADSIFASRISSVGSIGVLASYIEFAGTLERYNATYRSLTAGEFKDTGTPFKRLTPAEERMFQEQLDEIHAYFIQSVAENRGLPEEKVRQLANGWVYTGQEALEFGLIDRIGSDSDVIAHLQERLNATVELVEFRAPLTFFDEILGVFRESAFFVGKGIGTALTTPRLEQRVRITT